MRGIHYFPFIHSLFQRSAFKIKEVCGVLEKILLANAYSRNNGGKFSHPIPFATDPRKTNGKLCRVGTIQPNILENMEKYFSLFFCLAIHFGLRGKVFPSRAPEKERTGGKLCGRR